MQIFVAHYQPGTRPIYLFVITDEYSRFPVVEIVKSVSASAVIPVLDKVLSDWGGVRQIQTDNGSPFNSHGFDEFARHSGFHHRKITPRWPRANAQAEVFNKPLMKAVRAAGVEGKKLETAALRFPSPVPGHPTSVDWFHAIPPPPRPRTSHQATRAWIQARGLSPLDR